MLGVGDTSHVLPGWLVLGTTVVFLLKCDEMCCNMTRPKLLDSGHHKLQQHGLLKTF